jgi:5-oxoprolinase (ATP-hydrolysing)
MEGLKTRVRDELVAQGANLKTLQFDESLSMRYFGTDTNMSISRPQDEDYGKAFTAEHLREFAFTPRSRIVIDSVQVRGTGTTSMNIKPTPPTKALEELKKAPVQTKTWEYQSMYVDGKWDNASIYRLSSIPVGTTIDGPALVVDATQTIFIEPRYRGFILPEHVIIEKIDESIVQTSEAETNTQEISPIQLSVFAHRFMSIAEQMGNTLQRTSISTSIRERLDFSCAIFSPDGQLVANAPHIPIHLGSMQLAIQAQHKYWAGRLKEGDVLMTNHPEWGGTHLPDITVVTPVFVGDQIAFYTASRGHHTDIGKSLNC